MQQIPSASRVAIDEGCYGFCQELKENPRLTGKCRQTLPYLDLAKGWQQSRQTGELLLKSFYYLAVFVVCSSYFPNWL